MEAEKIKAHIDAVQRELLEKYHLTQHSFDGLAQYYRYRFHDRWETDKVAHYHFLISADDEESNLAIFLDLYRSFNQLQKNFFGFHLKKYTEADILANPNLISKRGKNDFVLISNCHWGSLTEEERQAWETIQTILNDPQAPTCFLLASPDVFNQKFQNTPLYEKLYHQTFRYHIEPKRNYSVEDYQNELSCFLDREFPGITRTASFTEEMGKYLSYVLANNPTYHDVEFLEDLKKRVILEYYALDQVDVIDERCVPYYNRERAAAMAEGSEDADTTPDSSEAEPEEPQTENAAPEVTEPAAPTLSPVENTPQPGIKIKLTMPPRGDFFEIQPDAPADYDVKNVLLLTLSTLNAPVFDRKSTFDLSDLPGEHPKEYYYQLEPVPYKLMRQFDQENQGQRLDGIIMVCSTATRKDTKTGNVSTIIDPEANPADTFTTTVLEYFKYKTADYAQKLNAPYVLSFKEIDTALKAEETDTDKRTMDTISLVHDVVEEIRKLNQHYKNLNIHVDTHGGFRTTQEILNGVLSLLQMEGVTIKPANIHTVELSGNKNPDNGQATTFLASGGEIFNLMNFISGIHECINYGQVKSLSLLNGECSEVGKNILNDMQTIAEGIQLCDVERFESGLESLSKSLPKLEELQNASKNDRYLSLFRSLIYDNYTKELLTSGPRDVISEILWCIKKGFIQQALTLIESKMPGEIIRNGLLYSPQNPKCIPLFQKTKTGTVIRSSEVDYLNLENSPKKDWESVDNYIFNHFGFRKKKKEEENYIDLHNLSDTFSNLRSPQPVFMTIREDKNYVSSPKKDSNNQKEDPKKLPWEERSYFIQEHGSAPMKKKIAFLILIHMQLKQERNSTNHAVNGKDRYTVKVICDAILFYIDLYKEILHDLGRTF